jgi:LAS superfamily LD-carboxypeptidase LdcB
MAKPTDNSEVFIDALITLIQQHLQTVGGVYMTTGLVPPSPIPIPGVANWTGYSMEQPFEAEPMDAGDSPEEDLRNENEKDDDTPDTEIGETKRILGGIPKDDEFESEQPITYTARKINWEAEEVTITSVRVITRTERKKNASGAAVDDEEDSGTPPTLDTNIGASAPPKPPGSTKGEKNGRLDTKKLSPIDSSYGSGMLHIEAAKMYNKLLAKAKKDGVKWSVSSTYRDYAGQVACYAKYGSGSAAKPGSSPHGWGLAIDFGEICGVQQNKANELGVNRASPAAAKYTRSHSKIYNWLSKNGPTFGWYNPYRLADGTGMDEAWHWEYFGFYTLSKEERQS